MLAEKKSLGINVDFICQFNLQVPVSAVPGQVGPAVDCQAALPATLPPYSTY